VTGWTTEQATELLAEAVLVLLGDVEDDDEVRPVLAIEAIRDVCAPGSPLAIPEHLTAGELRRRIAKAREQLAEDSL
jgi:hypothetical protein